MELIEPVFAVQTIVSLSSLTFSMYMLSQGQSPGLYLPVITAIIGYWIPSPTSALNKRFNPLPHPSLPVPFHTSAPSAPEVVQANQTLPV
jgi:hypothetical protein